MEPVGDSVEEDIREEENGKFKMNKKARLREVEALKQAQVPNRVLNIYLVPRKLLVFDINKVLLHRQAKSSYFKIRPHAYAFIASMSERYTLAVWTSMTKKSAKPILADLFPQQHIPLLFNWYQNRCHSIPNEVIPDGKPLFLKELSQVWREFPHFNESNTILVDDTSEKCARNPVHTSIQPCPYEPFAPPPVYNAYLPPVLGPGDNVPSSSTAVFKQDSNEIDLDDLDGADATVVPPVTILDSVPVTDPAELDLSEPEEVRVKAIENNENSEIDQLEVDLIIAEPQKELPVVEIIRSEIAIVPTAELSATAHQLEVPAAEIIPLGLETELAPKPVVFRPPLPPGPPPPQPPVSPVHVPFNPYLSGEDCELMPGGPLWNYLDQLARHDGPVQDVFERLGPYRFY